MFPFFQKKTLVRSVILQGFTDWHCHLLPGVDDGVQTLTETLQVLACYEEWGIREVWLTPHIMEDIPNTTRALKERFARLQQAYAGNITLHLSAENMLDNLFEERLEQNDLLPLGKDGRHLLVETSYFNPPLHLTDLLKRIQQKGYIPVLAHPERYEYMDENDYRALHGSQVRFQLNLPSLAGRYGKRVQAKAEWLLKQGFYDLCGTDTHRLSICREVMTKAKVDSKIVRNLQELKTELGF